MLCVKQNKDDEEDTDERSREIMNEMDVFDSLVQDCPVTNTKSDILISVCKFNEISNKKTYSQMLTQP